MRVRDILDSDLLLELLELRHPGMHLDDVAQSPFSKAGIYRLVRSFDHFSEGGWIDAAGMSSYVPDSIYLLLRGMKESQCHRSRDVQGLLCAMLGFRQHVQPCGLCAKLRAEEKAGAACVSLCVCVCVCVLLP